MKKKGFATSAVLYTMLLLFLVVLVGILNNLQNKKTILDQLKVETINAIQGEVCLEEKSVVHRLVEALKYSKLDISEESTLEDIYSKLSTAFPNQLTVFPSQNTAFKDVTSTTETGKGIITITGSQLSRSNNTGSRCFADIESIEEYDLTYYNTVEITYTLTKYMGLPNDSLTIRVGSLSTTGHTTAGTFTDVLDISDLTGKYKIKLHSVYWDFSVSKIILK